jgi:hypothetical protein
VLWGNERTGKEKKREGSVVSSFLGGKDDLPHDLNSQFN